MHRFEFLKYRVHVGSTATIHVESREGTPYTIGYLYVYVYIHTVYMSKYILNNTCRVYVLRTLASVDPMGLML